MMESYYAVGIRTLFDYHDADNDGLQQPKEVQAMLKVLGYDYNDEDFMRGFQKIEKKFPNEMDFDDFNDFWQEANCIDPLGVLVLSSP